MQILIVKQWLKNGHILLTLFGGLVYFNLDPRVYPVKNKPFSDVFKTSDEGLGHIMGMF